MNNLAEVKILIEGFVAGENNNITQATITLVKDENKTMVVDPGVLDDQKILIDALKKEGLSISDVNYVCITHSHLDHYRNIGMFPKAKTLEYYGVWDGGKVEDSKERFSKNIRIVKTPGHNYDGLSLLVKTNKGVVAIVGDIWWKEEYPKDDPYASDTKKLEQSRKKILKLADYIIPGHGKMFRVEK